MLYRDCFVTQGKLELVTGATASMMQLQLFDEDGKIVCEMDNDCAVLDSYPVKDGYRIHVSSLVA